MPGFVVIRDRVFGELTAPPEGLTERDYSAFRVKVKTRHTWQEVLAQQRPRRGKYSLLILKEAVLLKRKEGVKYASQKTGVGVEAIFKAERRFVVRGDLPALPRRRGGRRRPRYTIQQKRACIALALQIMAAKPRKASFIEAGRRMGMNGDTIYHQWLRDDLYEPISLPTQQPSNFPLPQSGISAASPQTQLRAEQ